MFSNFEQAIRQRDKEGVKSEFTFIGIKESSLEKYEKKEMNFLLPLNLFPKLFQLKKIKMIK